MWHVGGDPKVSEGIRNLYAELDRNSDRAVGVLAGSIVETHLTEFLKRNTKHYGTMWNNRTHSSGPLGTFAVKIDVLYMFGLISKEAHFDLVRMKDIRNTFAHDLEINNFTTQPIKDWCENLRLVDRHVADSDALSSMTTTHLAGKSTFTIGGKGAVAELCDLRLRYVWSAKVFSMAFGHYLDWPLPPI